MSEFKCGDECIVRATRVDGGISSLIFGTKVIRCKNCVNWGSILTIHLTTVQQFANVHIRMTGAAGAMRNLRPSDS